MQMPGCLKDGTRLAATTIAASTLVFSSFSPITASADARTEARTDARTGARTGESWLFGGRVEALEGTVISERPGFSSSPDATPIGRFNVEAGIEYGHEEQGAQDVHRVTLPFGLLRMGVVDRLELRLGWAGTSQIEIGDRSRNELADPTLGFKWQINEGSAVLPRFGFIFDVALPVGEGTGSDAADVVGALAWSHPLGSRLGLFGTSTLARRGGDEDAGNGDDLLETTHAAGLGLALGGGLGTFIEYFVSVEDDRAVSASQVLDGGFTYLLTDGLQLDLSAGVGLDDSAQDLFIASGVAYRW